VINFIFILNSLLLGVGLAMDAFSVSLANGLNEPKMKGKKSVLIAGVFAFFQALMPMLGWVLLHTILSWFNVLEKFIPWIALALLAFIGIKMIGDGVKHKDCDSKPCLGFWTLIVQGIATSIDALSVGITFASYDWLAALVSALIIMVVTFVICLLGVFIGKKFGSKLANKATIFGGVILILIGIEIFVTGLIGI
jgi:putative Mn2+ efflux pump MntP